MVLSSSLTVYCTGISDYFSMSYQTTGWNDCPPILDIGSAKKPGSRRKNASGTQINNLNNGFVNNKEESATIPTACESSDEILAKFDSLLGIPNKLNRREFAHYSKKLKVGLSAALEAPQNKDLVSKVVNDILQLKNIDEAKSLIVNFMLVYPGVSGWALPLRKVVENIDVMMMP
ncbi:hypothetical protein DASC09_017950 [Saccharomycopsis crataegensis]|uniref:Uncharacterized protein n=1 Tax=Saccharomycopsis crataegensis TaxID=43959 RepID=A0AAV5QJ12_9ASCO|nr:hypothetical protein DASC09_017950 [Saccharomycopsis crataegensis]